MVKLISMLKTLALKLIRFYQKWISLDQGVLSGLGLRVCRFEPYCSEYTYQSIDKYGLFKGSLKGFWRILRCNPFTKGGYDPLL
jgi:putative membrane protein insertion efficiency factor